MEDSIALYVKKGFSNVKDGVYLADGAVTGLVAGVCIGSEYGAGQGILAGSLTLLAVGFAKDAGEALTSLVRESEGLESNLE